jgi:quercetin dioxygenase-like cupin family protein
MPFIDTAELPAIAKQPGWRGRLFHSASMTFAHWEFAAGSTIHAHAHDQEEVWHLLGGKLEIPIGGATAVAGPGMVAIVPAGTSHSVRALSDGKAIVVDHPRRPAF